MPWPIAPTPSIATGSSVDAISVPFAGSARLGRHQHRAVRPALHLGLWVRTCQPDPRPGSARRLDERPGIAWWSGSAECRQMERYSASNHLDLTMTRHRTVVTIELRCISPKQAPEEASFTLCERELR
jgi:hypothetical protein